MMVFLLGNLGWNHFSEWIAGGRDTMNSAGACPGISYVTSGDQQNGESGCICTKFAHDIWMVGVLISKLVIICVYTYVYIIMYIYICVYICIYIYIYLHKYATNIRIVCGLYLSM